MAELEFRGGASLGASSDAEYAAALRAVELGYIDESALETALRRVRTLQGLLPICAYRKRIRDDQNYWSQVETYLADHSDVQFSHGICPSCLERVMADTQAEQR